MIFAFWHACLGFLAASTVALLLRRHSASARCWAWRLGLLKGPLALMLAIPVVVGTAATTPMGEFPLSNLLPSDQVQATPQAASAPQPFDPRPFLFVLYVGGVAAVVAVKVRAAQPVHRDMPRVEGVLRPKIVIPASVTGVAAQMAHAHEAAHVQRRDPAWSFIADVVCAALWFAPPVWFCAAGMRAEAEAACDADAVTTTGAAKKAYAKLLVSFTGPAPANALGGSARRLARRIHMLNTSPSPLARPVATALIAAGLATLLPWQAIAAPPQSGLFDHFSMLAPKSVPLDWAASVMFYEPGVKEKIGWTKEQDATLRSRQIPAERFAQEYARKTVELQKTATMNERTAYARKAQIERTKLDREAARIPWTAAQLAQLRVLAIQRFGSAVWTDRQVASRLSLTSSQRAVLAQENTQIKKASDILSLFPPIVRPALPLPNSVRKELAQVQNAYNAAKPGPGRDQLLKRISNLRRPYEPLYGNMGPNGLQPLAEAKIAKAWALRRQADQKLSALLSNSQRDKLQALTQDPAAWLR